MNDSTGTTKGAPQLVASGPTPILYADRLYNVGVGPGVAKLTFANETGDNQLVVVGQVIIPTASFLEALEYMSKSILENGEFIRNVTTNLQKVIDNLNSKSNEKQSGLAS